MVRPTEVHFNQPGLDAQRFQVALQRGANRKAHQVTGLVAQNALPELAGDASVLDLSQVALCERKYQAAAAVKPEKILILECLVILKVKC